MGADPDLGRLRWRCRRGMKELDTMLCAWLDTRYAGADAGRRAAFEKLLEATDPELLQWVYRRERPVDPAVAALLDEVLDG